ncbi:WxL domain-containing protein [Listeria valentina]|uniref:WxL domain-containing protein n=1 Tax=Listeria valentina TaxID=2705293 RepID=UPI0014314C9B|nr:WxL domain-containing protein [Listeria valentina]
MKTTKIVTVAGLASLLTLTGTPFLTAYAADGGQMNSIGTIEFTVNKNAEPPQNPLNPDPTKPIVPKDEADHEPGTEGPLSIDYVSNFRFLSQETSGTTETYYADLDHVTDKNSGSDVDSPNFVQVTDKRGSNSGWRLTVTQNEQFKNENGKDYLDGAVLTLNNGLSNSKDGGTAPTVDQGVKLTPGATNGSEVMNATAGQGTGTWFAYFGKDDEEAKKSIELVVPGNAKKVKGMYTTKLTWTLTDSPA